MTVDQLLPWRAPSLCSDLLRVPSAHANAPRHHGARLLFDRYPIRAATRSALKNPSSSSSSSSSSRVKKEPTPENDAPVDVDVWDSNAESVRGRWKSGYSSSSSSSPSVEDRSGQDVYGAENNWQWWYSGPDDDAYAHASGIYGEDEEDEDEDDSFLSWFSIDDFDPQSVMSMLKWIFPAAAIFLPWLLGGPMFFMAIFIFSPWIQKLAGALMPRAWKVLWQGLNSQERSKQKQRRWDKTSSFSEGRYDSFWGWMKQDQPSRNDDNEQTKADELGQLSKLGGWNDFDEDFLMLQKISRSTKNLAVQKRRKKREVPLLFRFVLAIFPFLRTWGGFL